MSWLAAVGCRLVGVLLVVVLHGSGGGLGGLGDVLAGSHWFSMALMRSIGWIGGGGDGREFGGDFVSECFKRCDVSMSCPPQTATIKTVLVVVISPPLYRFVYLLALCFVCCASVVVIVVSSCVDCWFVV